MWNQIIICYSLKNVEQILLQDIRSPSLDMQVLCQIKQSCQPCTQSGSLLSTHYLLPTLKIWLVYKANTMHIFWNNGKQQSKTHKKYLMPILNMLLVCSQWKLSVNFNGKISEYINTNCWVQYAMHLCINMWTWELTSHFRWNYDCF